MIVSTTRPAPSNRICPIARRRLTSGVTSISRHAAMEFRRFQRVPPAQQNACSDNWFRRTMAFLDEAGRTAGLAGQVLFEPVDMIVAIDDVGLPDQCP